MDFELHITCTKDIDYLEINFADGTNTIKSNNSKSTGKSQEKNKIKNKEIFLDINQDEIPISQEIVKKPEIPETKREVKIAKELQNLDV